MKQNLIREFAETNSELFHLLSTIPQQELNLSSSAQSWSSGEVLAHLVKSDTEILKSINGQISKTGRDPEEEVAAIKTIFLDFTIKFSTADFLTPDHLLYEKEKLNESLKATRSSMLSIINDIDISGMPLIKVPGLENYTVIEMMYFVIYHTRRHLHQIKNILLDIRSGNAVL